jgi:hypothetical protein
MKQGKKAKKGLKSNWRRRYISVTDEGNGFGPRLYCYKVPPPHFSLHAAHLTSHLSPLTSHLSPLLFVFLIVSFFQATGSPKIIDLSDFDTIQSDPKRKYAWRLESKTNSNVVALGLYADTQDEYDGWLEIFTALVAVRSFHYLNHHSPSSLTLFYLRGQTDNEGLTLLNKNLRRKRSNQTLGPCGTISTSKFAMQKNFIFVHIQLAFEVIAILIAF